MQAIRTFVVAFYRFDPDGHGHDCHVLQRQVVVYAGSGEAAADAAKTVFCESAGISDWRILADTYEVARLADLAVPKA